MIKYDRYYQKGIGLTAKKHSLGPKNIISVFQVTMHLKIVTIFFPILKHKNNVFLA